MDTIAVMLCCYNIIIIAVHVVTIIIVIMSQLGSTRDMPITIDSDSEVTPVVDTSAGKELAIVVEGSPLKVFKGRKYR